MFTYSMELQIFWWVQHAHMDFLGNQNWKSSYAIENYMKSQIDLLKMTWSLLVEFLPHFLALHD